MGAILVETAQVIVQDGLESVKKHPHDTRHVRPYAPVLVGCTQIALLHPAGIRLPSSTRTPLLQIKWGRKFPEPGVGNGRQFALVGVEDGQAAGL